MGDKHIVRIMDKYPPNLELKELEHAIIVDDLVQSGGTIYECFKALKLEGVRRVSASCTHAVFPNREFINFYPNGKWAGLENFWISDSVPLHTCLDNMWPFRVLSIAEEIFRINFNVVNLNKGAVKVTSNMPIFIGLHASK